MYSGASVSYKECVDVGSEKRGRCSIMLILKPRCRCSDKCTAIASGRHSSRKDGKERLRLH